MLDACSFNPMALNQLARLSRHAGFGLLDLIIAMLIAGIGINGLMRYQQSLAFQFSYVAESRLSWRLANQLLDIYPAGLPPEFDHWHYSTTILSTAMLDMAVECQTVKAMVKSPKNYQVELTRVICFDQ